VGAAPGPNSLWRARRSLSQKVGSLGIVIGRRVEEPGPTIRLAGIEVHTGRPIPPLSVNNPEWGASRMCKLALVSSD
jgi:hypothetical protein